MEYFPVRYDSRVVIYERKMFIRLATDRPNGQTYGMLLPRYRLRQYFWYSITAQQLTPLADTVFKCR